ncbi:MAG TPA: sigma-70 family RNA polymerase sigma factor [Vicinamibacterales bacterium]|jgi:RNA polymerase sigma-70 factor (ECF subfamily)
MAGGSELTAPQHTVSVVRAIPHSLAARLYSQSGARRWAVAEDDFARALDVSVRHGFPAGHSDPAAVEKYLTALHLEDLALACACAAGCEAAWELFIRQHRPALYRTADALDPSGGARELADALYADLYGTRERDGERQSLFRYFHGRSTLATWLRAILAQRHVDVVRARRRDEPLTDEERPAAVAGPAEEEPERRRCLALIERALSSAIAVLTARDRLRLASYYSNGLTLAQTGRLLNEHEATVSRQLARTRRTIRQHVEQHLRSGAGLDDVQIEQCFACAIDDPGPLDLVSLLRKDSAVDRSI